MRILTRENYFKANHSVAIMILPNQEDATLHGHEFWEIQMVTKGKGLHITPSAKQEISKGDFFVIPPKLYHGYENTQNLGIINFIYFPDELGYQTNALKEIPGYHILFEIEPWRIANNQFSAHLKLQAKESRWLHTMAEKILDEIKNNKPWSNALITALFYQFQIEVSKIASKTADKPSADYHLGRLLSYFENSYSHNITLDECAEMVHMSRSTLNRFFNEFYGVSPMDYLINLRLTHACERIRTTTEPITHIAFDCGFTDSNYFTRIFKKRLNCTPRDYRNRLSKSINF